MEEHDPEALQRMVETADTLQGQQGGSNFLDVANSVSSPCPFAALVRSPLRLIRTERVASLTNFCALLQDAEYSSLNQ